MLALILVYLLHTLGELCLSPIGLSLVTKLAPVKWVSLLMGVWFLSPAIAQFIGGSVDALVEIDGIQIRLLTHSRARWRPGDLINFVLPGELGVILRRDRGREEAPQA